MDCSKNSYAERVMGRRNFEGVIPFDLPPELGYECPVCHVGLRNTEERPIRSIEDYENPFHDVFLMWSEYEGFLWCPTCNRDYPSALCVPMDGEPYLDREWVHHGPESAVNVFLSTVERVKSEAFEAGKLATFEELHAVGDAARKAYFERHRN